MTNHYDTIIIGAGQSDLTPNPSPKGEGNARLKNKASVFTEACRVLFAMLFCISA